MPDDKKDEQPSLLPNFYLTLISIIQSLAFGVFLTGILNFGDFVEMTLANKFIYVMKASSVFLMLVIIWHEFAYSRKVFHWIPNIIDSIIPFVFGLTQYFVIISFGNTVLWLFCLALFAITAYWSLGYTNHQTSKKKDNPDLGPALRHQRIMIMYSFFSFVVFAGAALLLMLYNLVWLHLLLVFIVLVVFIVAAIQCSDNSRF